MSKRMEKIRTVRPFCPEDVRAGDFVMVMRESFDLVWPGCFPGEGSLRVERVSLVPNETGMPVRVEAVCVPFVLVRDARGRRSMIDTRRVELARVSGRFGRAAFGGRS